MTANEEVKLQWRKSNHSMSDGNCVQVGCGGSYVLVRDSKNVLGSMLVYDSASWCAFVLSCQIDSFSIPRKV